MIYPVILAGGSGTRLWPLSRELHPKQLLDLVHETTMLQDTVLRLSGYPDMAAPLVICNDIYRFMVAEQLRTLGVTPFSIILEPVGRNTAPAVTVAALKALETEPDAVLLILPADHFIRNVKAFHEALSVAAAFSETGHLVTFGIVPDAPETGYGYIRKGVPLSHPTPPFSGRAVAIDAFVEKPDLATAESYVTSGAYCWNSGMFMFRASVVLEEMERYRPDILNACRAALETGVPDLDFFRLNPSAFTACPSDSIDYAVMEKTHRGAMAPLQAGWNDLGSWEALWQVGEKDGRQNVVAGDVMLHDVRHSYIRAESRLVAAIGLENHIVVETADAVLISPRNRVQDIKNLVNALKSGHRQETLFHKTTFNPWGAAETLVTSERFQVRRVNIKPGAALSLQKHYNRAEHWIVVRGTALVTKDTEEIILREDASIYIPPGISHKLMNLGKIPLEIIEVQSGSYLGEDDIVRMD